MDSEKPRSTLQTVDRAFALLELVAMSSGTLSVAEAADRLGLNISTCHHLVKTLEGRGYLRRDNARKLRLDSGVVRLSAAFTGIRNFDEELELILQRIAREVGETAFASEWDGNDMIIRHVVDGTYTLRVTGLTVGLSGTPHSRASGKAVLAFLPPESRNAWLDRSVLDPITTHTITERAALEAALGDVRIAHYATDLEEFALGVCCVAAPYFNATGRVLGAITVASAKPRFEAHFDLYRDTVMAAASEVTSVLSGERGALAADEKRVG
ncbi:MAG: IclR family transcriptional regulator [Frankiales bacterium]|nr:IclR family transcriptional regulator [Frankiales bacterium]